MSFKFNPSLSMIVQIVIFAIIPSLCHQNVVVQIQQTKMAHGLINRMIPINVSEATNMIHSAKTTINDDGKYLAVHPATVYPNQIYLQKHLMLPTQHHTILEQLRSYKTARYRSIVIVGQYIFLHLLPNKIVIVKQKQSKIQNGQGGGKTQTSYFQIQNTYTLQDVTSKNQTKMYKIINGKQIQVLMTIKNSKTVYKLGLRQSYKYQMKQIFEVGHLQFVADNVMIVAQNQLGVGLYRMSVKGLDLIKRYTCQDLGLIVNKQKPKPDIALKQDQELDIQQRQKLPQPQRRKKYSCFISDLSYNAKSSSLYILDAKSGLTEFDFSLGSNTLTFDKVSNDISLTRPNKIMDIVDCDALDFVTSQHFILICQVDMPNPYIQQIIKLSDPLKKDKKYWIKKDPIYHNCNFNDLIVTDDFFLAFDSFTIDVFWNSFKVGSNSQFTTEHTTQHFSLPGLQVFGLRKIQNSTKMYLYAVQSNILFKYELIRFDGAIYIFSPIPIKKQIKIQVPGKCDIQKYPTLNLNKQIDKSVQCFYQFKIDVQITQKMVQVSKQKISMSIGIIIIMLAVILVLTWICLVKYRGLESHARKILQRYREKTTANRNKFTL